MKKFTKLLIIPIILFTCGVLLTACFGGGKEKPCWTETYTCNWGEWHTVSESECHGEKQERFCLNSYCLFGRFVDLGLNPDTRTIPGLGCDWSEWEHLHCGFGTSGPDAGMDIRWCERCDDVDTRVSDLPLHDWNQWHRLSDPTCATNGLEVRVCERNKTHNEVRELPALGHNFGDWARVEPTCTTLGSQTRICATCSFVETQVLPALGHDYAGWSTTQQPTCVAAGSEERICINCHHIDIRSIAAYGHILGPFSRTIAPTCTNQGQEEAICITCNTTVTRPIAALGHSWGGWTQQTPPTCATPGIQTRQCSVCGFVGTGAIPALGHNVATWTVATPPTCSAVGIEIGTCLTCGDPVARNIPRTDHNFGAWSQHTAPTCTTAGVERRTCSICGHFESREGAPAIGHNMGEWSVTTPPTCMATGTETRNCLNPGCSHYETDESPINTNNHSYGSWIILREATCDDDGYRVRVCAHNPLHIVSERINPLGCNWVWVTTLPPTCLEPGEQEKVCSRCNAFNKSGTLDPLGHAHQSWERYGDVARSICLRCCDYREVAYLVTTPNMTYGLISGVYFQGAIVQNMQSASGDIVIGTHNTVLQYLDSNNVSRYMPITRVGDSAFRNSSITSVTISGTVTLIGWNAFRDCVSLTTVTLMSGYLENIAERAFAGCINVSEITIPATVVQMGDSIFENWTVGQTIYIEGFASQAEADAAWGENWRRNTNATIVYLG